MSSSSKSKFKPLEPKHIFLWFAFAVGGVACYLLYKDANIPVASLFKKMFLYGIALTITGIAAELGVIYYSKKMKQSKRRSNRDRRNTTNRTPHLDTGESSRHHRHKHRSNKAVEASAEND